MAVKSQVAVSREAIAAFCRKWQVTELALFGSVLREDSRADSDVDLLVTFAPEAKHSVFDLVRAKQELEALFERNVDLVEKQLVEQSPNYIRRRHILDSAEVIYGPGPGVPA